eukprot:g6189.t2
MRQNFDPDPDVPLCGDLKPCPASCQGYSCPLGWSLAQGAASSLCPGICSNLDCCEQESFSPGGKTCSNGIPGVEAAGVCCKEECGTCGGTGCSTRVPGFGQYDCCVGRIVETGVLCSESGGAPCIVDEDAERCSNGIPGVESTGICCAEECGTCGGTGCSTRVPGFGQYDCCVGPISRVGVSCGVSVEAPCIVEDMPRCSNGVAGVDGGFNTCCSPDCGLCDHSDCVGRGWDECCVAAIVAAGVSCGVSVEAPCIQGDPDLPRCSNGIAGVDGGFNTCCSAECGLCDHSDCIGHGWDECCVAAILASHVSCDVSGKSPCIVDDAHLQAPGPM